MSQPLMLGISPDRLRVNLSAGGDFDSTLILSEDWPVGTALSLVFADGSTWDATIDGANASWAVDKATTDTVARGATVALRYVNGTTDQIWARGTVVRHDG